MVGHFGNEVRLFEERGAAGFDCGAGGVNVVYFVVENGAAARFWFLWSSEHKADVAAPEESEVAGVEKELHAEGVLVEVFCAGEVIDGNRDLSDRIETDGCCGGGVRVIHRVPPVR
jgi:hypothetical protein